MFHSAISNVLFQPLLLGLAAALMIIALIYQEKETKCGKHTERWGVEIFKKQVGLAIVVVFTAVIISFMSGL